MGLIKSINDITYELQGQKTEKEIKKQQQTRKRLLKTELYNYFDFRFRRDDNAEATYFEMLKNKMLIIDQLKREYSTKYNVKLNFENISYLKQNYLTILNSVKRQYFELERIKQKEEKQTENEKPKENINAGAWIGGIITTILIVIFLPLLFCLFIIGAALKSI